MNQLPGSAPSTARELSDRLAASASFRQLPPERQREMQAQASKIFGFLEGAPSTLAVKPFNEGEAGTGEPNGSTDVMRRAGDATRGMLDAIAFPDFVASLVQGTFQAMVDSSIQQMEAYSQLLASVAKTVDQFMDENITDDMAKDHLADNYGDLFSRQNSASGPKLGVTPVPGAELPSFIKDLGFADPGDLDEGAVQDSVVPKVKRTLAETRHQSLATMVMMGLNRIVVDEGEINAKLIFNVDASDTTALTFHESKPTNWTLAGQLGRNAFGASGLVVSTTNLNTQSDLSIRAELTGEVKIKFKSDYFPLERFADSAAIQLINNYAKPLPAPAPATEETGAGATPPPTSSFPVMPAPAPPPLPPMNGAAPPPPALPQSLSEQDTDDAWSVRAPEEFS